MLHLLLVILTAGSPSPSASPSASPSSAPLKTIVTLKSSPYCTAFAAHANAAIDSAVHSDAALSAAVGALRSDALGHDDLQRVGAEHRLSALADKIYGNYRSGMREVDRLRELAKTAPTEDQKSALKASADALGGALYRQHLIQRDLDGFVAYLQTSDMRASSPDDRSDLQGLAPDFGSNFPRVPDTAESPILANIPGQPDAGRLAGEESLDDDVRMSLSASHDVQRRIPDIVRDEMTAAEHFDAAGSGC